MELQLVTTEVAILAKELGFNWLCQNVLNICKEGNSIGSLSKIRNSEISRDHQYTLPEQELLAKWLRDIYGIIIIIQNTNVPEKGKFIGEVGKLPKGVLLMWTTESSRYNSYEEAMEASLKWTLDYLKNTKSNLV